MPARVPVFVCGERARGDDAAGFAAVELLPAAILGRVEVIRAGQLDVQLLLDLPADGPCVVVDAVAGISPGALFVRPLDEVVGAARARAEAGATPALRSSHELPLEQVLALAALLRAAAPRGTFIGVGGVCFDVATDLTPAVRAALPGLAAAIAAEVDRLAPAGDGTAGGRLPDRSSPTGRGAPPGRGTPPDRGAPPGRAVPPGNAVRAGDDYG